MMEQVGELLNYFEKKLGFKELSEPQIRKFYSQY